MPTTSRSRITTLSTMCIRSARWCSSVVPRMMFAKGSSVAAAPANAMRLESDGSGSSASWASSRRLCARVVRLADLLPHVSVTEPCHGGLDPLSLPLEALVGDMAHAPECLRR
jgi:hypothetical protein